MATPDTGLNREGSDARSLLVPSVATIVQWELARGFLLGVGFMTPVIGLCSGSPVFGSPVVIGLVAGVLFSLPSYMGSLLPGDRKRGFRMMAIPVTWLNVIAGAASCIGTCVVLGVPLSMMPAFVGQWTGWVALTVMLGASFCMGFLGAVYPRSRAGRGSLRHED